MQRSWNPLIAAVLSFIIPGAGSMYKGQMQRGALWLLFTYATYPIFIGVLLHFACVFDAYTNDPYKDFSAESEGYGGITSSSSETTRFLCASAVVLGWQFRNKILEQVNKKHQATAPEYGLNTEILIRVCKFLENREIKYHWIFAGLGVVGAVLIFMAMILIMINQNFAITVLFGPFVFITASAILFFYKSYDEKFNLLPHFTKERFEPAQIAKKFAVELDHDVLSRISNEDQNLVVYKGFSPFIGAGIDLGGWSFAVDVSRPKEHAKETTAFEISELYLELENANKSLELQGLDIKDIAFVNGADIRSDKLILQDVLRHPIQHIEPDVMKAYSTNDDFRIRHYKKIAVRDWGNEMIFSLFLRCSLRGKNLFVEVSQFLLTPLESRYRQIDSLSQKNWQSLLTLAFSSIILGPFAAFASWFALLQIAYVRFGFQESNEKKKIEGSPLYNYGVPTSIRQMTSSRKYVHYFQKLDREMYIKIINRNILDTISQFLDARHIDTSALKEQRTTIVNNGVLVQGGNIATQSLAAGISAQAITNQLSDQGKEK